MIRRASPARLLGVALFMAAIVVGILLVLLHSPVIPAIVGGALFGALFLFIATGLGGDPEAADAAWRAEAADLASPAPRPIPLDREDGED
ncbi:MAG: hypothetical protein ACHQ3P_08135 [Candidatus Limnocylindrales bacterium]